MPKGFTKIPNVGGGDCLFLSISQALRKIGKKTAAAAVRATAVAHLSRHALRFKAYWDEGMRPDGTVNEGDNFEKHLELVARPKAYAGYMEIVALASTLNYAFVVVHQSGNLHVFNREGGH